MDEQQSSAIAPTRCCFLGKQQSPPTCVALSLRAMSGSADDSPSDAPGALASGPATGWQ
jgi:hypothetical protein